MVAQNNPTQLGGMLRSLLNKHGYLVQEVPKAQRPESTVTIFATSYGWLVYDPTDDTLMKYDRPHHGPTLSRSNAPREYYLMLRDHFVKEKRLAIQEVPLPARPTVAVSETPYGYVIYSSADDSYYYFKNVEEVQNLRPKDVPPQSRSIDTKPKDRQNVTFGGRRTPAPEEQGAKDPDAMDVDSGRPIPGMCSYDPIYAFVNAPGPFRSPLSLWKGNKREGLRLYTKEEMRQFEPPESPADVHADEMFNDELFSSLQDDILPFGANPVNDYLRRNLDPRHRMFMDAAIGNQGCCCEHEKTPLDKYLKKHRPVYSKIGIKATVSKKVRDRVKDPVETKRVRDLLIVRKAQEEKYLKDLNDLLNRPMPANVNDPFGSHDDDEDMNIT